MKAKYIIGLALSVLSFSSVATELPQATVINNALHYLNQFWGDEGKSLSSNTTAQYFTPDTTLIINGKTVFTGYTQFESHFKTVGKQLHGQIIFPVQDMIVADNKVVVHFHEKIYDVEQNYFPADVMAIFTLKNNKIQKWEEVVNSPLFDKSTATSAIFSKH